MYFGDYIKTCRTRFGLTQQDLVELLFEFHPVFHGLDTVTLSRWERNITSPNIERQRYFIEAMQQFDETVFPAFDAIDMDAVEDAIFEKGIQRVIGKHKTYILDLPSNIIESRAIHITELHHLDDPNPAIHIAYTFFKKVTNNHANIPFNTFKRWVLHPSSRFWIATYYQQFFGMLLSLRLKEEPFEALLNLRKKEHTITADDFAKEDEEGYEYPLTFLGYTEQAASLLFLRYYRYLMNAQAYTAGVGCFPKRREGAKLVHTLGLSPYKSVQNTQLCTCRANMPNVLLNRYILTMIFKASNRT